jgi:hypothetical protein
MDIQREGMKRYTKRSAANRVASNMANMALDRGAEGQAASLSSPGRKADGKVK